jgi:hypothetical protein
LQLQKRFQCEGPNDREPEFGDQYYLKERCAKEDYKKNRRGLAALANAGLLMSSMRAGVGDDQG